MLNKIISTLFFLVLLFIIIKSISSSIKNLNIYVYYFSKIFKQIFIFYFQPASVCGFLISWKWQVESKFSNNVHFCYFVRVKISEISIIPEILFLKWNGLCCNIFLLHQLYTNKKQFTENSEAIFRFIQFFWFNVWGSLE